MKLKLELRKIGLSDQGSREDLEKRLLEHKQQSLKTPMDMKKISDEIEIIENQTVSEMTFSRSSFDRSVFERITYKRDVPLRNYQSLSKRKHESYTLPNYESVETDVEKLEDRAEKYQDDLDLFIKRAKRFKEICAPELVNVYEGKVKNLRYEKFKKNEK